ncbi:carbon-nitrogen hydrolase family protein [Fodinicurvata sediminis]|uniref:carbon-nitrogen hydrolase family protein n=1 Tax=Fodinicurvata sediminis TaxID=1121832 RepID=UPI0003B62229|nr:carbon-nitrogen hydrolase family protein [Fodinicurvata sediminis]
MTTPAGGGAPFKAGCIQMTAGTDLQDNIDQASVLIRKAAEQGADFVLTPENTSFMIPGHRNILANALPEEGHPALNAFASLARELDIWLLLGSLTIDPRSAEEAAAGPPERVANRSILLSPGGEIAARYDKIHMFDVDIPDGQTYRESRTFRPGREAVTAELPWGRLGMSVCYDVRFANLYRGLARAGADFISVPAAFTRFTGQAHWHVLLRARAIETGCFVLAPAQCGTHAENRETYGHALIVAPWGEVLADAGPEPGVVVAEIDPAEVSKARGMVPALSYESEFSGPAA